MAARRAAARTSPERFRLAFLGLALVLAWAGLAYRLVQVQVVRADELQEQGLDQRLVRRTLAPDRGTIFDRNGDPLAMTIQAKTIYAVPDEIPADRAVWVAQQIAAVTGKDWSPMRDAIAGGGRFAYLARQLEPDMAQQVLDLRLPGVYALPEPKRVYPDGPIASHVVGMVSVDGKGLEGLEYYYDDLLSGTPGELVYERDVNGRSIPQGYREVIPAVPGDDLVTTADLSLQYSATEACDRTMERTSAEGCWIVVLDAESGEVLAMVGSPGFDPETRQGLAGNAFTNFAVRGMYEPGSTQKLITFSAALDTGTVGINTVIPDVTDRYEVTPGACDSMDDDIYGCFGDFSPHETRDMTTREIFTISSNIGTIKVQERLRQGVLADYVDRFGFGKPTGIDYSGEAAGQLNLDPTCSSCLASAAIGYSLAVTPLQMAAAYAAIANDGVWTEPFLVSSRVDVDGTVAPFTPVTRRVVSENTAWVMRQLLADVVAEGTGQRADIPGYTVGGKTGTADKLQEDGTYGDTTIASFVGMAPIEDPKLVVAVVVDAPAWEYRTGGAAAAPAFAEVMEAALHRMGVVPDADHG
jgi:cell division protein FtsI/penicillin-binding protein 2